MPSVKWTFGPPMEMKVLPPVMLSEAKHLLFLNVQSRLIGDRVHKDNSDYNCRHGWYYYWKRSGLTSS
jgi:hypothetical protein